MTVAIFEPDAGGHHMALHVRHIARAALARGWKLRLVTTERAMAHPAYKALAEEFGDRLPPTVMPDTVAAEDANDVKKTLAQFQKRAAYAEGYKALPEKPDAAYMVNLDQIDLPMSIQGSPFGDTPFTGILMGRNFHCRPMGIKIPPPRPRERLMGPVFNGMAKIPTLKRVLVLDETMVEYVKREGLKAAPKMFHVPDIASLSGACVPDDPRASLGIPADRFVMLSYGALGERKGVVELVAAVAQCDPRVVLLLAGRQDDFTKAHLAGPEGTKLKAEGRLFEMNAFLDDAQEATAFAASDAVWVGYRGWYGMSGVLVQSGAAGLPVVSMDEGLVAYLVERHKLGLTVPIADTPKVAAAIMRLANEPSLAREMGENGLRLAPQHTPEAFGNAICDHIQAIVPTA